MVGTARRAPLPHPTNATAQEKGGRCGHLLLPFSYPLLTEMQSSVLAAERGAGLTGETVRSAIALVVSVVVGVAVAAERRGSDGSCGADRAADHACGYVSRPQTAVAVFDHSCGLVMA